MNRLRRCLAALGLAVVMAVSFAPVDVLAASPVAIDFNVGVLPNGQVQVVVDLSNNPGDLWGIDAGLHRSQPGVLQLVSANGATRPPAIFFVLVPAFGFEFALSSAAFDADALVTNMFASGVAGSDIAAGTVATLVYDVVANSFNGDVELLLAGRGPLQDPPQPMTASTNTGSTITPLAVPTRGPATLTFSDGRIAGSFEFYTNEVRDGVVPVEFERSLADYHSFRVVTEGLADGEFTIVSDPPLPVGVTIAPLQIVNNRGYLRLNFAANTPAASEMFEEEFRLTLLAGPAPVTAANAVLSATTTVPVELTINAPGMDPVGNLTFAGPNEVMEGGFAQISAFYGPASAVDPSRGIVFEVDGMDAGDWIVGGATIVLAPPMSSAGDTITVRARVINIANGEVLFPTAGWAEHTLTVTAREVVATPAPTVSPTPAHSLDLSISPLPATPLSPGEEFDITVRIGSSRGFADMALGINIPPELEATHLALGFGGLGQGFANPPGWNMAELTDERDDMVIAEPISGRLNLAWNRTSDYIGTNQELFVLTLRARENARLGFSSPISVELEGTASNLAGHTTLVILRPYGGNLGRVRLAPGVSLSGYRPGDADGNGTVDVRDLTLLRQYLAGVVDVLGS